MNISDLSDNNPCLINLNHCCRLCAKNYSQSELFHVLEYNFSFEFANLDINIPNFLNFYLDIPINSTEDPLPKLICRSCLNILQEFMIYKKNCQESQDKLKLFVEAQKEKHTDFEENLFEQINTNTVEDSEITELNLNHFVNKQEQDILADNKFICIDCGNSFAKHIGLQLHRRTCNLVDSDSSKQKGPFTCNECFKVLPTWVGYRVHQTMHYRKENGIKRKSKKIKEPQAAKKDDLHVCYICGKTFKQGGALKLHLLFHSKTKKFECDICKKRYYTNTNLKDHLNTHSNERKFPCKICGKSFFTNRHLNKHAVIHRSDLKKISCTMCSKKFVHPYQIQMHMMVHTGQKPYNCTICEAKFRFPWDLRKHTEKNHKIENLTIDKEVDPITIEVHVPTDQNDSEIYYEYM